MRRRAVIASLAMRSFRMGPYRDPIKTLVRRGTCDDAADPDGAPRA
jgi:hypothetical protein